MTDSLHGKDPALPAQVLARNYERHLFFALMEHLPDHIYSKDLSSRFIAVNQAMSEWLGASSRRDVIGKTDFDFFSEAHAKQAFEDEQKIIQGGESIIAREEMETWPDGRQTWVSTTKVPLRDDKGVVIGTFGVSRDITALKKMEETLAAKRDLLNTVMNNLPDPIYVKDSSGRYVNDNLSHRELLGAESDAGVIGKTGFDFFSPEVAANIQTLDQSVLDSGKPLLNHEEEITTPSGEQLWFLTTKVPLRDQLGRPTGLLCIGRDVTEKKNAEKQLEHFAEELRTKNQALEEDLQMARELQQSMLPQRFPCLPKSVDETASALHFHHYYSVSKSVSGDFFDVLEVSDSVAGVFICDVMGHGVRAAMVAAMVRTLLGDLRHLWASPGELLNEINRGLRSMLDHGETLVFVSAFYLTVDIRAGEMCYANAGHPLPLCVHQGTAALRKPTPLNGLRPGPALGLFDAAEYEVCRGRVFPHDVVLLFTDGLFEVEGAHGAQYDYGQLAHAIGELSNLPATELCRQVVEEVQQFSANHEFDNDVCLIAVEVDHLLQG